MKNTLANFLFCILLAMVFAHVSFAANTTAATPSIGGGWSGSAPLPNLLAGSNLPASAAQIQFQAQVNAAMQAMHTAGAAMATDLVLTGENLIYIFYAITFAWYVYEGMASQQLDVLFKKWISQTMIALIALEMLLGWTGTDTTGAPSTTSTISISNFLINGLYSLADPIIKINGGDPTDNVINAYYPAIVSAYGIITAGLAFVAQQQASTHDPISAMGAAMGAYPMFFVTSLFALLSAGLLAIAMIYALFFTNLGDFIIYIGLTVGPIFVATLVFPAAQGFFSKWLEFVISGAMYKLIAVVVGVLLSTILVRVDVSTTALVTAGNTLYTNGTTFVGFMLTCFLLMFWSLFAYFITKQIPHFVTALTGGANIHLSSLSSLAPHPSGSMPKFGKPEKADASETAEIKAATAIRTAEIKAASAASTAATKAASKANSDATKAVSKANSDATNAASKANSDATKAESKAKSDASKKETAIRTASIKAANELAKLEHKQSGPKVVGSGSSDGAKAQGDKPSSDK